MNYDVFADGKIGGSFGKNIKSNLWFLEKLSNGGNNKIRKKNKAISPSKEHESANLKM